MSAEIKIIVYVGFVACLFFVSDRNIYLLIFVAFSILLSRLPFQSIRKGWVPISFFMLFTFVSNAISQNGRILLRLGTFAVTEESLSIAFVKTARFFFMIAGAKILTSTTKTESLAEAFGNILKPLGRLGMPVDEFSSTMGLALKALPKIKKDIGRAYEEKMRSGEVMGFKNRTKVISSFLFPLFIESIKSPEKFFEDNPERKEGKNPVSEI